MVLFKSVRLLRQCRFLHVSSTCYGRHFPTKDGVKRKYPIDESEAEKLPILDHVTKTMKNRVYVWGRGHTGALGIPLNHNNQLHSSKVPKRLVMADYRPVLDAVCGYGFTVFVVDSNDSKKVYGCGINTDSQLGVHNINSKDPITYIVIPQAIPINFQDDTTCKVLALAAGRAHLLILTNEGLYTLGNNSYGQCGRMIIDEEKYSGNCYVNFISSLNDEKITNVKCGQDHSLALTESGKVFSCGWGADGQTGLGKFENQDVFSQVGGEIAGERIVKVAGKGDCVLALNDSGDVFGWGNSEYGQLHDGNISNDVQQISNPIHLKSCRKLGKIVDIAAGGSFCMVLNDSGEVFVWGYGILGNGNELEMQKMPVQIPRNLFRGDVKSITCGLSHCAAMNSIGDVFTWGRNIEGSLGLGHTKDQLYPMKVHIGASVAKIECGYDHTVAVCTPYC